VKVSTAEKISLPKEGADACVRFTWSVRAAELAGMCGDGVY